VQAGPGPTPPKGSILQLGAAIAPAPISNMASSFGYPWTTGMITMKATTASGTAESFKITGKDTVNPTNGVRTIQFVAGSVSQRTTTGPNANRAWVRLVLRPFNESPALSPMAQLSVVALMLLGGGFLLRRRLFTADSPANG